MNTMQLPTEKNPIFDAFDEVTKMQTERNSMTELPEFISFDKIPRLNREIVIYEKIDGTNAQVYVDENENVFAGSRTRWITPEDDNHGFAAWVEENKIELAKLGPGRHYGEWVGLGIQRSYGLDRKVFYLFNASRWKTAVRMEEYTVSEKAIFPPSCCDVVPILYKGVFSENEIKRTLLNLSLRGSKLNSFPKPEGIVIYHVAARQYFKVTLEKDEEYKGKSNAISV